MLALVRVGYQGQASIVADPRLLQLYQLRDFDIRSVQLFQLFDVAGPHPRLIEGTIIRERVFIASADPEEGERAEKHEFVPHASIVSGATGKEGKCVVQDTRAKGQVAKTGQRANLTNAFSGAIDFARRTF